MEKVFVKVDYQILDGGAVRPVRIHWRDGRVAAPKRSNDFHKKIVASREK